MASECRCNPVAVGNHHYVQWIGTYFGDCIYTPMDQISFWIGLIGIMAYAVAMFPQYIKNYQRKSVEGLSAGLVILWMCGDVSNLIGTFFTNQFVTQRLTAMYFVLTDLILAAQYVWYSYIRLPHSNYAEIPSEEEEEEGSSRRRRTRSHVSEEILIDDSDTPHSNVKFVAVASVLLLPSVQAFAVQPTSRLCNAQPHLAEWQNIIGSAMAWASGLLYVTSRIPQIYENYKLKSVQGMSLLLFVLMVVGNLGYSLSVIFRIPSIDSHFYASTLPYLLGSLGVFVFDMVIYLQSVTYGGF